MLFDEAVSQTLQVVCNLDLLCFLNVHVYCGSSGE